MLQSAPQSPLCREEKISIATRMYVVILGSVVLAAVAQLSIPLSPVPVTLQSTTAILLGFLLGPRLSALTIIAYLLEGLCGLPVFANFTSGPAILLSPTAGYLVGMLPAALLSGLASQQLRTIRYHSALLIFSLATIVIFSCGVGYLTILFGWHKAITVGAIPFILTEGCKIIVASWFVTQLSK